jgi:hypothetical protein
VIQAIRNGEQNIPKLRGLGGNTSLTDPEIAETVQTIADEFPVAYDFLTKLVPRLTGGGEV